MPDGTCLYVKNKNLITQKVQKIVKVLRKSSPHWAIEATAVVAIFALIGFATGMMNTATIGQEISLMNLIKNNKTDDATAVYVDFEVSSNEDLMSTYTIEYDESQICFIGDNRVVGMQNTVKSNAYFIAKYAADVKWFVETASVEFEKIHDDVEVCVVKIGLNDLSNAEQCIETLNEFASRYPDKKMVLANLGPIDENKYKRMKNIDLENFNSLLAEGLSEKWQIADLYSYLNEDGFLAKNGIDYSSKDSEKIFEWLIGLVKSQTVDIVGLV